MRKRTDADFCSDEHREKYHARTRRSMEVLVEAEERMVVTRRLNEGFPLRAVAPSRGTNLDDLVIRNPDKALYFGWMPAGLPVSRAHVETYIPAGRMFSFRVGRHDGVVPPPVAEPGRWGAGHMQEGPRPPRPFTFTILLAEARAMRVSVRQAACDRPRRPRHSPPVELGTLARGVTALRLQARPAAKSMGALLHVVHPPDPARPPRPSPPIVATLRHPLLAINLGRLGPFAASIRMPELGMVGINYGPAGTAERPPAPAYVPIVRRTLAIPAMRIGQGGMARGREPRGAPRFVPCPAGFRRKQYYSWELLERLCGMGYQSIANHRPEIRIAAAPCHVPRLDVSRIWAALRNDSATAQPEPRRPAPPFQNRVSFPGAIGLGAGADLRRAVECRTEICSRNVVERLAQSATWQCFAGFSLARRQGGSTGMSPAQWASGSADALAISAWARPQPRGAKRTACHSTIAPRNPVFFGPDFVKARRQAGPAPERPLDPPRFEPQPALVRGERVTSRRNALLPSFPSLAAAIRPASILPGGCEMPVGRSSTAPTVHPAHRILRAAAMPLHPLRAAAAGGLRLHPPARQSGGTSDIARGLPKRFEQQALQRFRKRGYEALRSTHTDPRWPAWSTPGLIALRKNTARPHPLRQPDFEGAAPMFRACGRPAVDAFRRACTLMEWGTLAGARPGMAEWGRESRPAGAPLVLALVLPSDPHGPIRDWGLAPPPEPEKPPEPIHEDFASGLANWICANSDWRQDIAGVRTGSLALLRPSLPMRDYEFEFLGRIENHSMGWVFRASNTGNYHAVQIALSPAGGGARLVRFSVVAGDREQPVIDSLPVAVAQSASCRVKMVVSGNDFKMFLNDKPAGEWSDDRLPDGGIGFFSDPDDRARLYWVKVTPYFEEPVDEPYAPAAPARSEIAVKSEWEFKRHEQRANAIR